ncbi:MAG: Hsp20/alpha crystallin family protein [Bacteroidales bacterium]|nr:Hsp20/alpha crystallin family protein [Bacteroidales bacterium]
MLPTITKRGYSPLFLSNFFDNDFDSFAGKRQDVPAVNIREGEKVYSIEMALPGMDRSDVKIEFEKDTLVISSEISEDRKDETDGYSRKEFGSYAFCRSFRVPENVASDKISATFKNGVLEINLPKSEDEKKINRVIKIS